MALRQGRANPRAAAKRNADHTRRDFVVQV